jgi:ABC-type transport system substrate-binding protein
MKHAFLDRPCTGLARIGVIALLLSLGTALLTGTVLAQPVYGGTLMVGLADDPPELDPHRTSSNASRTVLHNIFATLVEVDEDLQLQPELAHAWDVSDDGLVYTFHLRDDVLFHDGTRFDAEAVRYNFHRMTDPDFGSARAGELAFVTDVTVVDDFTVQVTLSQPFAAFLPALASWSGMMVSPTAAEEFGDDFSNSARRRRPVPLRRAHPRRPRGARALRRLLQGRPALPRPGHLSALRRRRRARAEPRVGRHPHHQHRPRQVRPSSWRRATS